MCIKLICCECEYVNVIYCLKRCPYIQVTANAQQLTEMRNLYSKNHFFQPKYPTEPKHNANVCLFRLLVATRPGESIPLGDRDLLSEIEKQRQPVVARVVRLPGNSESVLLPERLLRRAERSRPYGPRPSGGGNRPSGISDNSPSVPSGISNNRPSGISDNRPSGISDNRPSGISDNRPSGVNRSSELLIDVKKEK